MKNRMELVSPLSLAAGLMLPLAVISHKALAPLFVLTAILAIARYVITRRAFPPMPKWLSLAFLSFLVFATASALWSLTPTRSFQAVWPVAGIFLGIVCLVGFSRNIDESERRKARNALLIGFTAGLMLIIIERATDYSVLRASASLLSIDFEVGSWKLKPAASIGAILFWLIIILLYKNKIHRAYFVAVTIIVVGIVALVRSDASLLGLALGGAAFWLALRWARTARLLLAIVLTASMMGAPWIPTMFPDPRISMTGIEYLPNSAVHRIIIWQVTAQHIRERFWVGHGFDTARSLYTRNESRQFQFAKPTIGNSEGVSSEPIPLHPHNMILQIWLELGAFGAALTLIVLLSVFTALARAPIEPTERAVGYGFFVTALTVAAVAYGAWQAWWLSALGLSSILFFVVIFRRNAVSNTAFIDQKINF